MAKYFRYNLANQVIGFAFYTKSFAIASIFFSFLSVFLDGLPKVFTYDTQALTNQIFGDTRQSTRALNYFFVNVLPC